MKFIRDLLARKSAPKADASEAPPAETSALDLGPVAEPQAPSSEEPALGESTMPNLEAAARAAEQAAEAANEVDPSQLLDKINASVAPEAPVAEAPAAVNIWDMDSEEVAAAPEPEAASRKPRRRRNQTRVLGFNPMEADVVSIFDKAETVAPAARAKFPVGWVLVVSGPGRGECFTLEAGMSQIGRGEDQAVQLDFGDNTISRSNHAAIVYDSETHKFMLGHGGKQNIVRLNGTPVITNEELNTNDEIKIGETGLRFVALCSDEFNWGENPDAEESEDVAIA